MSFGQQGVEQGLEVPGYALGCLEGMGLLEGEAVAGVEDGGEGSSSAGRGALTGGSGEAMVCGDPDRTGCSGTGRTPPGQTGIGRGTQRP
jgi:hypothetical protein